MVGGLEVSKFLITCSSCPIFVISVLTPTFVLIVFLGQMRYNAPSQFVLNI
jgi:hypothetical protein